MPEVEVVVFDVLGTMVDEPAGLRAGLRAAVPAVSKTEQDGLLERWSAHIESAQRQVLAGERPFAPSNVLNREAAALVLSHAGIDDPAAVDHLAQAGWRLPAWPDSTPGLARLAARFPLIGLSNASRCELLRLNAHAGLRWHQALSAQAAQTYKPAAAVYQLAVDVAGIAAERLLMVAAHAWDLRGARALGMRTAYIPRPAGDPPASEERFDIHAESLDDLADQLAVPAA